MKSSQAFSVILKLGGHQNAPTFFKGKKLMFWLNPMEQQRYDAGWYSVEDHELWIQNKGPVIKKQVK